MKEPLTKALHSAQFLTTELREAHLGCQPIESLVLLPMIARAADLQREIQNLLTAIGE